MKPNATIIIFNHHWQEKVRRTVQNVKKFIRTERGCYALATAA